MKNLKIIFTAAALFLTASSFAAVVTGTITKCEGKKLYLEKFEENRPVKIDSAIISKKGKFTFNVTSTTVDFYRISFQPADFIVLILDPKDNVTLTADFSNLNKTYSVKGSKYSEDLISFVHLVNNFIAEKDSLTTVMMKYRNKQSNDTALIINQQLSTAYATFLVERNAFLDNHPTSPALIAVTNHLNLQNDPQNEMVHLKKIESALKASVPNSFYYTSINQMVTSLQAQLDEKARQEEIERNKHKLVEPGREVSNITFKNTDDKDLALASLRGKYVLIDYWASWCGPCRKENPNVVKMYNKYKDKGFEIYSISLDNNKDKWLDAIAKDGLIWKNHVSDLKGWQSASLGEFGVSAIPFTVLIDKEGKIIQANLRGPSLEMKLKEIFGE